MLSGFYSCFVDEEDLPFLQILLISPTSVHLTRPLSRGLWEYYAVVPYDVISMRITVKALHCFGEARLENVFGSPG